MIRLGRAVPLLVFIFLTREAAAQTAIREDFFIAPFAEVLLYSRDGFSPSGGIIAGVGTGTALGLRVLYAVDQGGDALHILEMGFFFRLYLPFARGAKGPFVQIIAGTVLFGGPPTLPAQTGSFSVGLGLGWRFLLGSRLYIEPAVRAGYPYLAGGGVSFGCRF